MHKKVKLKNSRGQSLFEILLALAVSTLIIVGVVSLGANTVRDATFSKNQALAAGYAQEVLDWLRYERDKGFDDFKTKAAVSPSLITWCISVSPPTWPGTSGACGATTITGTIFTREIDLTRTNSDKVVEAQVRVSWTDSQGTHVVNASTKFSDWRVL